MAHKHDLLSDCLWQQKSSEEKPDGLSLKDKPQHDMYHCQIEDVADIKPLPPS